MWKALPYLFLDLDGTASSARVEFYNRSQRAADDYDRDFIKKYDEDLDTTLILVSVSHGDLNSHVYPRFLGG